MVNYTSHFAPLPRIIGFFGVPTTKHATAWTFEMKLCIHGKLAVVTGGADGIVG